MEAATTPVRVLVVDDEQAVASVLVSMLRRRGLEAESVPGAAEARACAGTGEFDVALVDVGLRDGCGEALAAELERDFGLAERVILMTGGHAPREVRCALKPFNYAALVAMIRELAGAQGAAAPAVRTRLESPAA